MAKVDSGAKPLQNAMKMAKVAIQLDGGNRHKEAYCEYLRTINYISHALLEEAVSQMEKEMVSVEVARMLTLAEQCLERAKSFVGKSTEPPDLSASAFSSGSPGLPEPHQTAVVPASHTADTVTVPVGGAPVATDHKSSSPRVSGHSRLLSDEAEEPSPFLPPEVFHKLQAEASQDTGKKELTPIEEASRLNQKLKANYEARLARLTPGQAYQKTSLTLSLQRQMMENLIIAKARQDALQRKMEDRRLRLQEEANRYSELFINTVN
uniref:VPS9 domain-containing protein n=1 Tax=Pundamilia nyererei TaxID=303518 RepID=A0A3B4FKV3_9CICH